MWNCNWRNYFEQKEYLKNLLLACVKKSQFMMENRGRWPQVENCCRSFTVTQGFLSLFWPSGPKRGWTRRKYEQVLYPRSQLWSKHSRYKFIKSKTGWSDTEESLNTEVTQTDKTNLQKDTSFKIKQEIWKNIQIWQNLVAADDSFFFLPCPGRVVPVL